MMYLHTFKKWVVMGNISECTVHGSYGYLWVIQSIYTGGGIFCLEVIPDCFGDRIVVTYNL